MKDIPPKIQEALHELQRLEFIALQKRRELQEAESRAAKQGAIINEMWREHSKSLAAKLKARRLRTG